MEDVLSLFVFFSDKHCKFSLTHPLLYGLVTSSESHNFSPWCSWFYSLFSLWSDIDLSSQPYLPWQYLCFAKFAKSYAFPEFSCQLLPFLKKVLPPGTPFTKALSVKILLNFKVCFSLRWRHLILPLGIITVVKIVVVLMFLPHISFFIYLILNLLLMPYYQ